MNHGAPPVLPRPGPAHSEKIHPNTLSRLLKKSLQPPMSGCYVREQDSLVMQFLMNDI